MESITLQAGCEVHSAKPPWDSSSRGVYITYPWESRVEFCPYCESKELNVYHGPLWDAYTCKQCGARGDGDDGIGFVWCKKRKSLLDILSGIIKFIAEILKTD